MKHTPGPWKVEYFKRVRSEANGEMVCTGYGEIKYGRTNEEVELLAEANARLIAAAPELYEALEDVLDAIGALSKWWELVGYGIEEKRAKEILSIVRKIKFETSDGTLAPAGGVRDGR